MVSSAIFDKSAKFNSVISTLGPSRTDSAHEARKHCSSVVLFSSFPAAAKHAHETGGYALIPVGYLDFQDGKLVDTWVDMHFRLLGQMRIVDVWESPTKVMCLAINRERVADRGSIRSIALHPATAAFARQACADAEITFVSAKPLAVETAVSGRVDACIGSVDVVAASPLEPIDYFHPTMVWTLYQSVRGVRTEAPATDSVSASSQPSDKRSIEGCTQSGSRSFRGSALRFRALSAG